MNSADIRFGLPPTELLKTLYQSRYGLTEPSAKI